MCKDQITILILDDDVDDQALLTEAIHLVAPSVLVKVFTSGFDLLDHLLRHDRNIPCLIVIDYNMPTLNGLQVLERLGINEKLINIPTVVWSTSNSHEFRNKCLIAGAMKYIVKPQSFSELTVIATEMIHICTMAA